MRIGVIGPASKSHDDLRRAVELFLADPDVRQIIYLGVDGAAEAVVAELSAGQLTEHEFLARGAELACHGSAEEIDLLLAQEIAAQRLSRVRRLPDPPARAIEMLEKWIVLAVHDKAILDEDDVANAHVIVYGKSPEANFKRFGPRTFLTPGPLSSGKIGRMTLRSDGGLDVALLDLDGQHILRESMAPTLAKMVVAS